MDTKDLISFFQEIRLHYGEDFLNKLESLNEIEKFLDNDEISKLDIKMNVIQVRNAVIVIKT